MHVCIYSVKSALFTTVDGMASMFFAHQVLVVDSIGWIFVQSLDAKYFILMKLVKMI